MTKQKGIAWEWQIIILTAICDVWIITCDVWVQHKAVFLCISLKPSVFFTCSLKFLHLPSARADPCWLWYAFTQYVCSQKSSLPLPQYIKQHDWHYSQVKSFLLTYTEREHFAVVLQLIKINHQLLNKPKDAHEWCSVKCGDTDLIPQQYPRHEISRVFPGTENLSEHHLGHQKGAVNAKDYNLFSSSQICMLL